MSETPLPPRASPGQGFLSPGVMPQRSTGLKLLLVCGLALLMAIPALFVYGVVHERSEGAKMALREVASKVGGEQSVLGPVLALPYSYTPDAEKPSEVFYGVALAYAETGTARSIVEVEERKRSIHLVPVYTADIVFDAVFDPAALRQAVPNGATPIWNDARLYTGLSDARGLKDAIELQVNGIDVPLEPASYQWNGDGGYHPVPASSLSLAAANIAGLETADDPLKVNVHMLISGAERLGFGPFAKDTEIEMESNWLSPSFTGGTLPDTHTVGDTEDGFSATWRVPYLARGTPGAGPRLSLDEVTAYNRRDMATRFIHEANPYQSVQRALKYAAMFVGFVFLSYFLFEVTSGLRAHPAQYVLVGLAQSIFYLLLLALSERIAFGLAFLVAATMTVTLTSAYATSVFRSRKYGLRAFAILSAIYGLIYMLMRAEGNALIAGAFASFAAIALTMWLTRNVDWYGDRDRRSPLPA
ncbi:MAG: cell envelope integrity protein CreD [Pseudomonadota bacterium]